MRKESSESKCKELERQLEEYKVKFYVAKLCVENWEAVEQYIKEFKTIRVNSILKVVSSVYTFLEEREALAIAWETFKYLARNYRLDKFEWEKYVERTRKVLEKLKEEWVKEKC